MQVPHDQGHLAAFPGDPTGPRGGPHQDGGEGGAQVKLQAVAAGTEDRGQDPHAA